MTKLLERAIEAARLLPATDQDEVAYALLGLIDFIEVEDIEPEHRAAVLKGLEQARQREFATDDDVARVLDSFGRRGFA